MEAIANENAREFVSLSVVVERDKSVLGYLFVLTGRIIKKFNDKKVGVTHSYKFILSHKELA